MENAHPPRRPNQSHGNMSDCDALAGFADYASDITLAIYVFGQAFAVLTLNQFPVYLIQA